MIAAIKRIHTVDKILKKNSELFTEILYSFTQWSCLFNQPAATAAAWNDGSSRDAVAVGQLGPTSGLGSQANNQEQCGA